MEDEALIATETQTVSVAHVRHGVTADVIRVVDVRGNRATMLRVWRASVPYVVRGQSEKLLCSTSDKAFRAAITSSLTDDTFITNLNGDFDMQGERYFTEATPAEVSYLKAAEVVGVRSSSAQLLSLVLVAGIAHKNGDPAACVDSLLAAAFGSPGRTLSASEAREQLYAMAQLVIPMPDSLPDPVTTKGAEGPYALALDEHPRVAKELEAFGRWSQNPVQLSRPGAVVADATRDNTIQASRMVLGWAKNVAGRQGEPTLNWLLDGELIAGYVSWGGAVRNKKPSSLSLEASSIVRLLEFMGAAARLDETSRSDLERLRASLRRLAAQLNAMHRPTTSIASLEAAGKWADHELVQEKVRAEANAVLMASESASQRDPRLARRVHDSLLSTLVTVDCAPNRPGCLRKLKTPDSQSPCECGVVGCLGNRFVDTTMVLVHSKTARYRSNIIVDFAGTLTERLLQHHLTWGRSLLLARDADTDAVWISTRGHAFGSDESFGAYLPRVLARLDLPHLSFTTLRHAAVVAASEWASREELQGLALSIGTSVRKLEQVYDYRCAERSAGRFLTAYRSRTSPPGDELVEGVGSGSGSGGSGLSAGGHGAAGGMLPATGAAAGSASSLLDAPSAAELPRPAPAPSAPVATPRMATLNPIQAFTRMLGLGRSDAPPAASEIPAPQQEVLSLEDGGAWCEGYNLPSGATQRGDARAYVGGGGGAARGIPSYAATQPATQQAPRRAASDEEDDDEDDEPPMQRRRTSLPAGGAEGGARGRVAVHTSVTSFADFLAAQKVPKKTYSHGPGRSAAPVKRQLTHAEATLALSSGIVAMRAAYAWAYGFATTSGNREWLRNKIEEAVGDGGEIEDETGPALYTN